MTSHLFVYILNDTRVYRSYFVFNCFRCKRNYKMRKNSLSHKRKQQHSHVQLNENTALCSTALFIQCIISIVGATNAIRSSAFERKWLLLCSIRIIIVDVLCFQHRNPNFLNVLTHIVGWSMIWISSGDQTITFSCNFRSIEMEKQNFY